MSQERAEYTTLSDLADQSGIPVSCEGNSPLSLDDTQNVWLVEQGKVDLFLRELKGGEDQAAPQHLLRVESGRLLPGIEADRRENENTLGVVAKGLPGTILKRLPVASLNGIAPTELADQIDAWMLELTDTLSRFVLRLPRPTSHVDRDETKFLAPSAVSVRSGVVWVYGIPQGSSLYMDMVDPAEIGADVSSWQLPLTRTSWLSVFDEVTLSSRSSVKLAEEGSLLQTLSFFHRVALRMERVNLQLAVVDDANLERKSATSRRVAEDIARKRLFNIYDLPLEPEQQDEDTALADALRIIGKREEIDFVFPPPSQSSQEPVDLIDILDASGVRARRVNLDARSEWWRSDSTSILGFRAEDGQPVALLPTQFGNYKEIDPVTRKSTRVGRDQAALLQDEAWMFYRPLPSRAAEPRDLLNVALRGSGGDCVRLLLTGLAGGLVKLVPAFALGLVANHLVNEGTTTDTLYVVAVALVGFGLLSVLLHLLHGRALMRLEARSASRIEAAFWDRLMRLPTSALQGHKSGDLAMSGMTFQQIRDGLQGVAANSVLSCFFLLPVFGVVFYFDTTLGAVALGFSMIAGAVTFYLGLSQVAPYAKMTAATRRVAGLLFEIIGGIAKLRVERAEGSAFAMWVHEYREQKQAELEVGKFEGHARAFSAALPFLAAAVLLFTVVTGGDRYVPVGDFLITYAVFLVFQHALARFGESLGVLAAIRPAIEQKRPLLVEIPQTKTEGERVDRLRGEVLFDRISFRYEEDGPLILDDVTIRARQGEFIAIAGESGSGKTTLFRLALGLDRPSAGAVYYDGRDLRELNLKQVRRRIGTVPQSIRLHPLDIWDNIVAHEQLATTEQVWQAVRSASIESEVKAMPMGLMTMVGSSGAVLSGGESQRVMIARSLFANPRVMLFDEATSWLDNAGQAEVMRNLALLSSTRIVIAHRLSTLEQADRIYVLKAGRVVETGSFEDLMKIDGTFKRLVQRQLA